MKAILDKSQLDEIQFLLKLMPITHFDVVQKITKVINSGIVQEENK